MFRGEIPLDETARPSDRSQHDSVDIDINNHNYDNVSTRKIDCRESK